MSFTPNYTSQRDSRWKDEKLGFDDTATIGAVGCALTSLTMLVNGYGCDETPSSMNRKLKDLGNGNGFLGYRIIWASLAHIFPKIVFRRIVVCRDQTAPLEDINASLEAGRPLLIEIDHSPSPDLKNHWVVIYARQGDDYLILDPWPLLPDDAPVTLSSRYGEGRPMGELITAVVWYESTDQESPEALPEEDFYVRVQADVTAGVRLRSAPMISAEIIATELAGTRLRCLESKKVAVPKIGVTNQWLKVHDPFGNDGYIAAWYVEEDEESTESAEPQVEPAQEPASPGMTVLVSQRVGSVGLRLRSGPHTASSILTVVQAGQELTVLESADQAISKIGRMNKWLNVNAGSHEGYVAAWYVEEKTGESSPAQPASPVTLAVIVSSWASAGLRMREQPDAGGKILKVLMPGTPLAVLESAETAQAKIGADGKWLNVKEPGGLTGYVAARYVTR